MTEMQTIINAFIEKCKKENNLKIAKDTQEKLVIALENMGKQKQKGGCYYIPDDEMADMVLDYENTIKEYYKESKPTPTPPTKSQTKTTKVTKPTTKVVKNDLVDDLFGSDEVEDEDEVEETNADNINLIDDDDLFGETKSQNVIPKTKWEDLELF